MAGPVLGAARSPRAWWQSSPGYSKTGTKLPSQATSSDLRRSGGHSKGDSQPGEGSAEGLLEPPGDFPVCPEPCAGRSRAEMTATAPGTLCLLALGRGCLRVMQGGCVEMPHSHEPV